MVLLNVNPPSVSEDLVNEIDQELSDEIKCPPTDLESDEPELESDLHREQIDLLVRILKYFWRDRQDVYVTGNLTVYYNEQQLKTRDFRGPDIFVVMGAEKRDRKSWVLWGEGGKYPNLVIELLSSSTARVDRGKKKQLYQDVWRLPNYFWFDPYSLEFAGFQLVNGKYEAIASNPQGLLWSDQLELYLGIHKKQLRWFTTNGELVPSPEEQERFAKEQAEERIKYLEAILRSQGIDPNL